MSTRSTIENEKRKRKKNTEQNAKYVESTRITFLLLFNSSKKLWNSIINI